MRVLMLGWEFPPFISGGLGTACFGLTRAMSGLGADVLFVLPKPVDGDHASHVTLLCPAPPPTPWRRGDGAASAPGPGASSGPAPAVPTDEAHDVDEHKRVSFRITPPWLAGPYQTPKLPGRAAEEGERLRRIEHGLSLSPTAPAPPAPAAAPVQAAPPVQAGGRQLAAPIAAPGVMPPAQAAPRNDYDGDVIQQAERYAKMAVDLVRGQAFDVIHAHDWMTYPAGLAISALSGKPLVVHVHSTEFDRAGEHVHQQVYEIERRGMHGAMQVICVSHLTRKVCEHRYSVSPDKLHVVYNGIDTDDKPLATRPMPIERGEKIVLFLGRLTMQKGPEYFVAAAKKVLQQYDRVKFVIAGSGDMAVQIIELAARMGIGHKVLFAGFLRGDDVERVFRMASVYVMPSVSEPFGIAPLEAIRHDVPVIISRNSGVSEVIRHALKVDFWDVDDMANKIIAVLRHPSLGQVLREEADLEVRQLTWEGAAQQCIAVYDEAVLARSRTLKGQPGRTQPNADAEFAI